jgi:hypothetical protein
LPCYYKINKLCNYIRAISDLKNSSESLSTMSMTYGIVDDKSVPCLKIKCKSINQFDSATQSNINKATQFASERDIKAKCKSAHVL